MVATPDSRCRKFSATRSAVRIEREAPATSATTPPSSRHTPSVTCSCQRSDGSTRWNTASAARIPAITPGAFCVSSARPVALAGTSSSVVASPAPTSSASAASISSSMWRARLLPPGTLPRGMRWMRGAFVAAACGLLVPATATAAATPATYDVGIAHRTINPTAAQIATNRVYLGGFGFGSPPAQPGRPATGILGDGASVRAFVVKSGDRAWAIADMEVRGWFVATKDGPYGIIDMRHEVEKRTQGGLSAEQVIVQSDHTHSGPDGMGVWGGLPLEYRQYIFEQTVSAIVDAWNARRPGTLWYGTEKGNGLTGKPDLLNNQFSGDPNNEVLASDVRVLQARDPDTGKPFATMLNFSAHGTVLGSSNTKVSGDWPQRTNPMLEDALGGQAMTVVGTLGRTQPNRPGCGDPTSTGDAKSLCELDAYSTRVVDRAKMAVDNATPITGDPVVAARTYLIQDPATNALLLGAGAVGDPAGVPLNRSLLPPWLTGNVIGTVTGSLRVGDILLSSVPGEIYPQIALKVRDVVSADPDHGARGFMT